MEHCPCGNSRPIEACCGKFLSDQCQPDTAEELMRSRFTAYATGATDYILKTQDDRDRERVEQWAKQSKFLALRVLSTQQGGAQDEVGQVEFEADYESGGQLHTHRETSHFERRAQGWVFLKGHPPIQTRAIPKVGRNEPCPCGSGKKFKKCCGA